MGATPQYLERGGAWRGRERDRFLVSSVAGTKAGRDENEGDRENSAELLKDFASVFS